MEESLEGVGRTLARRLIMSRNFRGWLYWLARFLGDVGAVRKGKVGKRIGRRVAGKASGKLLRRLFK
jgi:hypothetical protein